MEEDKKPVHASFDLSTLEYSEVEVSDEEHQAMQERDAADAAARREREQADAEMRQAAESHPDPLVRALAQRAGIL